MNPHSFDSRRLVRLGYVVLLFLSGGLCTILRAQTSVTFDVPALNPWTDTGIDVVAGQELTITCDPSQRVTFGSPGRTITADGIGDEGVGNGHHGTVFGDVNVRSAVILTLVGKVGGSLERNTGTPVPEGKPGKGAGFVGSSYEQVMTASGRLFLGFNDDTFGDNSGTFTVQIKTSLDLVAKSLEWDSINAGIEFSYDVNGVDLDKDTTAELWWANGPDWTDVPPGRQAVYSTIIERNKGSYGPFYVPNAVLGSPPAGATHLLLVVDPPLNGSPNGLFDEGIAENNNVYPLKNRPDIDATSLEFHSSDGGVDDVLTYNYEVSRTALDKPLLVNLYWATGPTLEESLLPIAFKTVLSQPDALTTKQHFQDVLVKDLAPRPAEAKYLLLVLDRDNDIKESDETNNLFPKFIGCELSVTCLYQNDSSWAKDAYPPITDPTSTIGRWGCAMSCLAMSLDFFGHAFTPRSLNLFMQNHVHNYTDQGWVNWVKTTTDASAGALHFNASQLGLDSQSSPQTARGALENAICRLGYPAVVGVNLNAKSKPGHYVLVTGQLGNDFSICDPDHKHTILSEYGRYFIVGFVEPTEVVAPVPQTLLPPLNLNSATVLDNFVVVAGGNVSIRLTDPAGGRLQAEPNQVEVIRNIPNAVAMECGLENDETGASKEGGSLFAYFNHPTSGRYRLDVTGPDNAPYDIFVWSRYNNGATSAPDVMRGTITSGIAKHYEFSVGTNLQIDLLSDSQARITLASDVGATFTIETSEGFSEWTPLTVLHLVNGMATATDLKIGGTTRKFYRAVSQ